MKNEEIRAANTRVFVKSQFVEIFISHLMFYLFGPFSLPIISCFTGKKFLINSGMLFSCAQKNWYFVLV